jgi:hypothetical protein
MRTRRGPGADRWDQHGVQPLIGDTVAEENDGVAVMQVESLRVSQQGRRDKQTDNQQAKHNENLGSRFRNHCWTTLAQFLELLCDISLWRAAFCNAFTSWLLRARQR